MTITMVIGMAAIAGIAIVFVALAGTRQGSSRRRVHGDDGGGSAAWLGTSDSDACGSGDSGSGDCGGGDGGGGGGD